MSVVALPLLKQHLRLPAAVGSEDELVQGYLTAAEAAFCQQSKKRWPREGEEPNEDGDYESERVLTVTEQAIAQQWVLLTVGHLYENRQSVAVGLNVTEVPLTARSLMNLIRVPTL